MNNPLVEIRFPVLGSKLKIDNGYSLYAAIKKHLTDNKPELLSDGNIPTTVRLSTIRGTYLSDGYIQVKSFSRLKIRCDIRYGYQLITALDNQLLGLPGGSVFVESGNLQKIAPSKTLRSRIVVIKYPREAELTYQSALDKSKQDQFIESCYKQLNKHQIKGTVTITEREGKPIINTITIEKTPAIQHYLGFGITVSDLTDEDSIKLQMVGIGGKSHFGCGWFDRWEERCED
jgi:CRISPR-associated protein Cas6